MKAGTPAEAVKNCLRRTSLILPRHSPTSGASENNELIRLTESTRQLIGKTPLVRLTGFDTGRCELYLKLESQNPGGSIKDRMAVAMIEASEESGALRPDGTLI